MKNSKSRSSNLNAIYRDRYESTLVPLAETLRAHTADIFKTHPRIDRITARAKDPDSFLKKANKLEKNKLKYAEPLAQIQDQLGVRIVTLYLSDVERVHATVKQYFRPIEIRDHVPESEWEFGYFGRHYVLVLPSDVRGDDLNQQNIPDFFELQIKTLFQHAWSEAEHDLGYKPESLPLSTDDKRKLAYTSAQAWGADQIFDALFCNSASTPEL